MKQGLIAFAVLLGGAALLAGCSTHLSSHGGSATSSTPPAGPAPDGEELSDKAPLLPQEARQVMIPAVGKYVFEFKEIPRYEQCAARFEFGGHEWVCVDRSAECLRIDGGAVLSATPDYPNDYGHLIREDERIGEGWAEPGLGHFTVEGVDVAVSTIYGAHEGCVAILNRYEAGAVYDKEFLERDYYCPGLGRVKSESVDPPGADSDKTLVSFSPGSPPPEDCDWPSFWPLDGMK